jgi:hypothetical protein
MAKGRAVEIVLNDAEKRELTALTRTHGAPQALADRARIVFASEVTSLAGQTAKALTSRRLSASCCAHCCSCTPNSKPGPGLALRWQPHWGFFGLGVRRAAPRSRAGWGRPPAVRQRAARRCMSRALPGSPTRRVRRRRSSAYSWRAGPDGAQLAASSADEGRRVRRLADPVAPLASRGVLVSALNEYYDDRR